MKPRGDDGTHPMGRQGGGGGEGRRKDEYKCRGRDAAPNAPGKQGVVHACAGTWQPSRRACRVCWQARRLRPCADLRTNRALQVSSAATACTEQSKPFSCARSRTKPTASAVQRSVPALGLGPLRRRSEAPPDGFDAVASWPRPGGSWVAAPTHCTGRCVTACWRAVRAAHRHGLLLPPGTQQVNSHADLREQLRGQAAQQRT